MILVHRETKQLFKYLGIFFIISIITHKLPHDSYSIIQYVIRPIRINNGYLTLSGIIPLILMIIAFRGLFQLERYKNRSKIGVILIYFIFIIPFMNWILDKSIESYHWFRNDGVNTINIVEEDLTIHSNNDILYLNIDLELIDYGRSQNEFYIRVFLPKSMQKYTGMEYYEFKELYKIYRNHKFTIKKQMKLDVKSNESFDKLFESNYYYEDVKYELYNSKDSVQIIVHGV